MATTDIVLFAVRAAMRLGSTARQAYVDSTKQRGITLPLPRGDRMPNTRSAQVFFNSDGVAYLGDNARLADLHARFSELVEEERNEYLGLYTEYRALERAERSGSAVEWGEASIEIEEFQALLTIRNWSDDDDDRPQVIRRVVGTVIDLSVEYFATVPGALSKDSKVERALAGFVDALDELEFDELLVEGEVVERLVGTLLRAALETIAEQPEFLSRDPNVQELVKLVAEGFTVDLGPRLEALGGDHAGRDQLESWGDLVFRSVLTSAGRAVLEEPGRFLGVENEATGALIQKVGTSLIELAVLNDELDLERVLGRDGLETIAQAALETLVDYPDLVAGDSQALQTILSGLAGSLASRENLLGPDLLPEVARLVLEHTGKNLELIWPDAANEPGKQALFVAAQEALGVLGADPGDAAWKLRFGRDEVLGVLDTTLRELAGNPAWVAAVLEDVDGNLGAALEATLAVLREHGDERLDRETGGAILGAAVTAIALRAEFLDVVPGGQPFVTRAIEIVVEALFAEDVDEAAQWQLLRGETISFIVVTVLDALSGLAEDALDEETLGKLEGVLEDTLQSLAEGKALDLEALKDELVAEFESEI